MRSRHNSPTNRIRKGSFFLATGGAPYDVRWQALSPEPFVTMLVFIKLRLLQRALEVGYANASHVARLFSRETGLSPSEYRRQR